MDSVFLEKLRAVLTTGSLAKKAAKTHQDLFSPDQREEMLNTTRGTTSLRTTVSSHGSAPSWRGSYLSHPVPLETEGF